MIFVKNITKTINANHEDEYAYAPALVGAMA
jgi:hypothetical protein